MSFDLVCGKILRTTEDYQNSKADFSLWRADYWIHFAHSGGMSSVLFDTNKLGNFIDLFTRALHTKDEVEISEKDFTCTLEEEDEGNRNLFISGGGLVMVYAMDVSHFPKLIEYLKEELQKEIADPWVLEQDNNLEDNFYLSG